jgi:hypothetical protein
MIRKSPQSSDTRTKLGFAILPIKAENFTIWLERYKVVQKYDTITDKWINWYFIFDE